MGYSGAIDYFAKFVKSQGINIVQSFYNDQAENYDNITDKQADEQLSVICEFHRKVMGYNQYVANRLENKTGRMVELYKVNIKRVKRYMKNLDNKKEITPFESLLLEKGDDIVKRAENCISNIFNSGYIEIIERSMRRTEVCLGKTEFSNIRKRDRIEVINLENCCYNMVEIDAVHFLNRLKKRGMPLNYFELVNRFCAYEELGANSEKLILSLMSYPRDFMRCANRYRENKKEWSEEEYIENLTRAIERDGDNLL